MRWSSPRCPGRWTQYLLMPDASRSVLTQYYTATTLDGFIADRDNSLDGLFTGALCQKGVSGSLPSRVSPRSGRNALNPRLS